jgi:hypothetical protein
MVFSDEGTSLIVSMGADEYQPGSQVIKALIPEFARNDPAGVYQVFDQVLE